jgi:hypothetical protein
MKLNSPSPAFGTLSPKLCLGERVGARGYFARSYLKNPVSLEGEGWGEGAFC